MSKGVKKVLAVLLVLIILTLIAVGYRYTTIPKHTEEVTEVAVEPYFIPETDQNKILFGYTMAVVRPDHNVTTNQWCDVKPPTPSVGTVLVPTNFMCSELCEVAFQIYSENKTDTLNALADYDMDNLEHDQSGEPVPGWPESSTPRYLLYRKYAAYEMFAYVKDYGKVTGDCYSQACFNAATLRLAGFSPENVFVIGKPGHAINLINADGKWYILDSTAAPNPCLFEEYDVETLRFLENDRYYVSFEYGYSNMDGTLLKGIIEEANPTMSNPTLAGDWTSVDEFVEQASYPREMLPVELPYTVDDTGSAEELAEMNYQFCLNMSVKYKSSQYDKALYALDIMDIEYLQIYANAAKMATWTQFMGEKQYSQSVTVYAETNLQWISQRIETETLFGNDQIAFPDIPIILEYGSTMDKALVAYGTMRNAKVLDQFIPPEDLYVIITNESDGYLAFNSGLSWQYLNFKDRTMDQNAPNNIKVVFNEIEVLGSWEK